MTIEQIQVLREKWDGAKVRFMGGNTFSCGGDVQLFGEVVWGIPELLRVAEAGIKLREAVGNMCDVGNGVKSDNPEEWGGESNRIIAEYDKAVGE